MADTEKHFAEMLAGNHGVEALDIARELKALRDQMKALSADYEKLAETCQNYQDKMMVAIGDKESLEEKHNALKNTISTASTMLAEALIK